MHLFGFCGCLLNIYKRTGMICKNSQSALRFSLYCSKSLRKVSLCENANSKLLAAKLEIKLKQKYYHLPHVTVSFRHFLAQTAPHKVTRYLKITTQIGPAQNNTTNPDRPTTGVRLLRWLLALSIFEARGSAAGELCR